MFRDPSAFDPKLTHTGIEQAKQLQEIIVDLYENDRNSIDCIVFSPMQRALMTGNIACEKLFAKLQCEDKAKIPALIALECIRERYGIHICDRRRSIDIIRKEYPNIDFDSDFKFPEDSLHAEHERETHEHLIFRGYQFLEWLNRQHNFKSVLVFSHSSYLMNMFNAVLDFEVGGNQTMQDVDDLKKWFNTGELKSVEVVLRQI